jgi:hypothetical protein
VQPLGRGTSAGIGVAATTTAMLMATVVRGLVCGHHDDTVIECAVQASMEPEPAEGLHKQLQLSGAEYGKLKHDHDELKKEHLKLRKELDQFKHLKPQHSDLLMYHAKTTTNTTNNNTATDYAYTSFNNPENFVKSGDGKRERSAHLRKRSNALWTFVKEYTGGDIKHPHTHTDGDNTDTNTTTATTTTLTGLEWELVDYITRKQNFKLVDVLLEHPKFRNKIAALQAAAARTHEKTEQQQSLSWTAASQLKLGVSKMRALHRRLCETWNRATGECSQTHAHMSSWVCIHLDRQDGACNLRCSRARWLFGYARAPARDGKRHEGNQ